MLILDSCSSQHADEEMMQMRRLMSYLQETGALAIVGGTEAPSKEFSSLKERHQIST